MKQFEPRQDELEKRHASRIYTPGVEASESASIARDFPPIPYRPSSLMPGYATWAEMRECVEKLSMETFTNASRVWFCDGLQSLFEDEETQNDETENDSTRDAGQ